MRWKSNPEPKVWNKILFLKENSSVWFPFSLELYFHIDMFVSKSCSKFVSVCTILFILLKKCQFCQWILLCAVQLQYGVDESYKLSIPSHGTQVYAHIEVSVSQVDWIWSHDPGSQGSGVTWSIIFFIRILAHCISWCHHRIPFRYSLYSGAWIVSIYVMRRTIRNHS